MSSKGFKVHVEIYDLKSGIRVMMLQAGYEQMGMPTNQAEAMYGQSMIRQAAGASGYPPMAYNSMGWPRGMMPAQPYNMVPMDRPVPMFPGQMYSGQEVGKVTNMYKELSGKLV